MRSPSLLVLVVTACAGAAPRPAPPANHRAGTASAEPGCTRRASANPPLTRHELEQASVPADTASALILLLGTWDGHAYTLDGELGEPSSNPVADGAPVHVCFEPDGAFETAVPPAVPLPLTGCVPRAARYALRLEETMLVLEVTRTGGCPGDASYGAPYTHPYYVHRLDDRFLVLVSGVTASVSGYRRR